MDYQKGIIGLVLVIGMSVLQAQVKPSATLAYKEGLEALDRMEYAVALEKFNEVLFHQPGLAEGYFQRAVAKIGLETFEGALVDYNLLLTLEPDHHEGLYARALLNYQLEKYQKAREDFIRLKSLTGGETNTIFFTRPRHGDGVSGVHTVQGRGQAYIHNYLGLIAKELGQYNTAVLYFDSALQFQPDRQDYYLNRGLTYQEKGALALAEKDYRQVLAINNDHALAQYNLATLLQQRGADQDADNFFTKAIEANPRLPHPYRQRAYHRIKAGDFQGALADLNDALMLDDQDAGTWLNKGIAQAKLKRWAAAVKSYSMAIELAPGFEKAYLNRGNTLYQLGLYEKALQDYQAALRFLPGYGMALYHRGLVHHKLGDDPKACADLSNAVKKGVAPAAEAKKKICKSGM